MVASISPDRLNSGRLTSIVPRARNCIASARGRAPCTWIKGFIHVHGARPRAEAMQFLARGTMLVSLPLFSRSGEIDATIPAKIFDYVRFDAWLLALAERGSATELLLRGT